MARCLAAVVLLLAPLLVIASDELPSLIGERNGHPAWVSAAHAIDDQGQLRPSLFAEHDLRALHDLAEQNGDQCRVYLGTTPEHFKTTSSLDALTSHAAAVVKGTIESGSEGFYFGMPGTLFRVSAQYLKGSAPRETYLFYPRARIETAEGLLCARPVGDFADPEAGERVLLFRMQRPTIFGDRAILVVDIAKEMVHERRGGTTRVPVAVQRETGSGPTFEQVTRSVEARIKDRSRTGTVR